MARAYSADLRERVLVACERQQGSQVEIARRYAVSPATVTYWRRAARDEGRRAAKPHGGGVAPRLDSADLALLAALVAETNDATLAEYADAFARRTQKRVSVSLLCRTLKRLRLVRKKDGARQRAGQTRYCRRARRLA